MSEKSVVTPKGTTLPLTNLKGRAYLMVAYRLQWFVEEVPNFDISTEFLLLTDEQTIAKATVSILDKDNKVVRKATATKRETKKDFSDHTEKAETSAIGRALAQLGFGTQFAVSDLDEGIRLADSPLVDTKPTKSELKRIEIQVNKPNTNIQDDVDVKAEVPKPTSTFRKPPAKKLAVVQSNDDDDTPEGWF